jgi:hypothetical protein
MCTLHSYTLLHSPAARWRPFILLFLTCFIGVSIRPLSAQTTSEPPISHAAAVAVDSVRTLYRRGNDSRALAVADSAMHHGLGSTALQAWRLAALARHPVPGITPVRTARRMASMYPQSPWAWMGLAMTAAALPDSARVARTAARKSLALAPHDSVVRAMAAAALQQAGYVSEAREVTKGKM